VRAPTLLRTRALILLRASSSFEFKSGEKEGEQPDPLLLPNGGQDVHWPCLYPTYYRILLGACMWCGKQVPVFWRRAGFECIISMPEEAEANSHHETV
jgi:hypothetical protein